MRRWYVVTPPFEYVEPVTDEGQGPTYEACDVIEVEAQTKRDALLLGVRAMLADSWRYSYCRDNRIDGQSPFAGVRVEPSDEPPTPRAEGRKETR